MGRGALLGGRRPGAPASPALQHSALDTLPSNPPTPLPKTPQNSQPLDPPSKPAPPTPSPPPIPTPTHLLHHGGVVHRLQPLPTEKHRHAREAAGQLGHVGGEGARGAGGARREEREREAAAPKLLGHLFLGGWGGQDRAWGFWDRNTDGDLGKEGSGFGFWGFGFVMLFVAPDCCAGEGASILTPCGRPPWPLSAPAGPSFTPPPHPPALSAPSAAGPPPPLGRR